MSASRNQLYSQRQEKHRAKGPEEEAVLDGTQKGAASTPSSSKRLCPLTPIPEVVDDFLRNFLHRFGLTRTLSCFDAEWYRVANKMTPCPAGSSLIPDALTHKQLLQAELEAALQEVEFLRQEVLEAGLNLGQVRREVDIHQMHHERVSVQKNELNATIKELTRHHRAYAPALRMMEKKHKAALRQKMLVSLEAEPVRRKKQETQKEKKTVPGPGEASVSNQKHHQCSKFPTGCQEEPDPAEMSTDRSFASFALSCSFKAHQQPISCIHLHPQKQLLASASDDHTWRMWMMPDDGEKVSKMLLTGEGHSDWLSGCAFHPDGTKVATSSGDCTVRLWDLPRSPSVLVLSGHLGPVWSVSFQSSGFVLASSSSDKTVKLWNLAQASSYLTLRHHAAAVRSVHFLPHSDLLLSSSADRTIALWDATNGLRSAVFVGHQNPCMHATVDPAGGLVASCDSGGVVNLWDIRKPARVQSSVEIGAGANQVAFSPTGKTLAVAGGDGQIRLLEAESGASVSLLGHRDSVQSVTFDMQGELLFSAGRDGIINTWRKDEDGDEGGV